MIEKRCRKYRSSFGHDQQQCIYWAAIALFAMAGAVRPVSAKIPLTFMIYKLEFIP